MKRTILGAAIMMCCMNGWAQQEPFQKRDNRSQSYTTGKKTEAPIFYIAVSTGLNNNTGIIGASFDVPLLRVLSVEGGFGISTWGDKLELDGKILSKPQLPKWLGAGPGNYPQYRS